jgi:hypothetical protein
MANREQIASRFLVAIAILGCVTSSSTAEVSRERCTIILSSLSGLRNDLGRVKKVTALLVTSIPMATRNLSVADAALLAKTEQLVKAIELYEGALTPVANEIRTCANGLPESFKSAPAN